MDIWRSDAAMVVRGFKSTSPAPAGGGETSGGVTDYAARFPTDPQKRYDRLLTAYADLNAAAQKVIDETNRIHDNDPWPIKYRAPYGAIVDLENLLNRHRGLK